MIAPNIDRAMHVVGAEEVKARMMKCKVDMKQATGIGFYAKALVTVFQWVENNFRTEGGSVGGWQKLADSTLNKREGRTLKSNKPKHGPKILQVTGQLKSNWKPLYDNVSGRLVSGQKYGIFHDSDKPRKIAKSTGKPKLPRRRILPTSAEMKPKFIKILEWQMKQALQ